jgi:hypothetical protein
MPGNHDAIIVDQKRIGKAKLPHGGGDFTDLVLRMRSRVPGVRLDAVHGEVGNAQARNRRCRLLTGHDG